MTFGKHGPGLVGVLVVMALGGMAFAASAGAATPEFLINKKPVGTLKATFSAKQIGVTSLLVTSLNLKVRCEKFTIQEGVIESGTDAKIKLLYEECVALTLKDEPYPEGCHIYVSAGDKKLHITVTALLLPAEILTTNAPAILLEKITGSVLSEGEECVMPEHMALKGEMCLVIDDNETVTPDVLTSNIIQGTCKPRETLEALGKEQASGGFKDKLLYGAQTATLDSMIELRLTGAHEGLTLGVSSEPPPPPTTTLCKAKTGSCEAYALGTKLSASLENEVKFVFPYEGEELEPPCKVSAMSGTTTKEGKAETPVIGELTALSFKECGGGLCTVTPQSLPYQFEIKATSEGNGTMTLSSGGGGSPAFAIKCLGLTKCIYGAATMSFTFTGGTPAKLSNSGVALKREAGSEEACGESGAKWEGIAAAEGKIFYKITTPSPLFVRLI